VLPVKNRTVFTYIVTRDYGFAPNPFPPYCTLAACKPLIRRHANVGDWIIGCGSNASSSRFRNSIIYAMQVSEKCSFDEYWNDPRFEYKKPVMNGSKKLKYGDNIYHRLPGEEEFTQEDSHHSLPGGVRNELNYKRDLSTDAVLVSERYWYWGSSAILLPGDLSPLCGVKRNHRKFDYSNDSALIDMLEKWLDMQEEMGFIGKPEKFSAEYQRYEGER